MDQKQLELELKKITTQQTQWHEDFQQRQHDHDVKYNHWFWQRGFWLFMAGAALMTAIFSYLSKIS